MAGEAGAELAGLIRRYTTANQRNGQSDVSGELVIMNWEE